MKDKIKKLVLDWMKFVWSRKVWLTVGIIVAIAEMLIAWGPMDCFRDTVCDYADGNGSWELDIAYDNTNVCQKVRPEYSGILQTVGIVVTAPEGSLYGGYMHLAFSDRQNTVLYEAQIPYESMNNDTYTYVEIGQQVVKNKMYYLTIRLDPTEDGVYPKLRVCDSVNGVRENQEILYDDNWSETQLVNSYEYLDALIWKKVLRSLFLSVITAFFIAFPLPKKDNIRRVVAASVLLLMPFLLGRRLELLTAMEGLLYPFAMKWNMLIMYGFEVILLLALGSMRSAAVIADVILTILYSANYYVNLFRGEALRISDFTAVGTAAQVAGRYDYTPNAHLYLAWCIAFLFGLVAWRCKTGKRENPLKKRILLRCGGVVTAAVVAGIGYYALIDTDILTEKGFANIHGFHREYTYYYDGYLVGTCFDLQNRKNIKYADYSEKRAEELVKEYSSQQVTENEENLPNVILILNESFADLRNLGNLQLSEENMPFYYGLMDNTVKGHLNVSVLGGGTANTEFEVLTGNSIGLLPGSYYPYMQCFKRPVESLVSVMKQNGYTTYSMHPESKQNWNRSNVYKCLGFDYSFWKEDFPDAKIIHSGVSDLETYKRVEQIYEDKEEGEKLFIFDLTMQNHSPYDTDPQDIAPAHEITATNVSSAEANEYLSLIAESDAAFAWLVEYFSQQEEKTVICMFGDHNPKFSDDDFYDSLYAQTLELTEEEKQFNLYTTPFVIWANYDIEEQSDLNISANYLGGLLLQTAGIPGNAYFNYLDELREEYPVITVNGYKDNAGNVYQWSGEGTEFSDYRILQYYELFD